MISLHLAFLVIIGAAAAGAGAGGDVIRSPQGYSVGLPPGWRPATPEELHAAVAGVGKDPRAIDMLLLHPVLDDFVENVTIVVTPGRLRIEGGLVSKYVDAYATSFKGSAFQYEPLDARVEELSGVRFISIRHRLRLGEEQPELRQWVAVIPGNESIYTLTCTAREADVETYEPAFRHIVSSFRGSPSLAERFFEVPVWGRVAGATFILVGCLGVVWLAAKAAQRLQRRSARRHLP